MDDLLDDNKIWTPGDSQIKFINLDLEKLCIIQFLSFLVEFFR